MASLVKFRPKSYSSPFTSFPFTYLIKAYVSSRKGLQLNIYRCNKACGENKACVEASKKDPADITKHWFEKHRRDCPIKECRKKKDKEWSITKCCTDRCKFCGNCLEQEKQFLGCMTFKPCPRELKIDEKDFAKVLKKLQSDDKENYYAMEGKYGCRREWIPYLRELLEEERDWRKSERYSAAIERYEENKDEE